MKFPSSVIKCFTDFGNAFHKGVDAYNKYLAHEKSCKTSYNKQNFLSLSLPPSLFLSLSRSIYLSLFTLPD